MTTSTSGNSSSHVTWTKLISPVETAFPHIQWDALSSLKLTAQETALLRMAETNPLEYTLADSRDASMYARVLLKLLAEATAAGAGSGEVSRMVVASDTTGNSGNNNNNNNSGNGAAAATNVANSEEELAMQALQMDPLGVVSHYALTKLLGILQTLAAGVKGVSIASVFYVGKEGVLVEQWKALLRVLNKTGKGDVFAQKVASLCLAKILITACPSQRTTADGKVRPVQYASAVEPLEAVTAWVISQLKSATGVMVAICTPALRVLMDAHETRVLFCKSGGIKYMARQIRVSGPKTAAKLTSTSVAAAASGNASGGTGSVVGSASADKKKFGQASVQQLYEITFCMWILTYELNTSSAIRADFAKDSLAVAALVDLISVAPREKVVRVALSCLRNMATCVIDPDAPSTTPVSSVPITGAAATTTTTPVVSMDGKFFLSEMIACGAMKAIDHLRDRQFTDPDLVDDVQVVHKLLHENYKEMSRWEVYKNEVESGHLQWGSTHTEAFFKENARMLEGSDGDFHILKVLISLITSRDEEVVAIACHDIGEFVRHYPNGRAIVKRLGAKDLVMPLIEHDNPELQRHALQCVSKIMVNHWEYVK